MVGNEIGMAEPMAQTSPFAKGSGGFPRPSVVCKLGLRFPVGLGSLIRKMVARRISCGAWIIAGVLAMGGIAEAAAGHFESPKEGPVAFRRDRLPIDVDLMTRLSSNLVSLGQAQRRDSAANRRTMAQMLALALALNPANSEARSEITAAAAGTPGGRAGKRELERSRAEIWSSLKWLNSPDAGPDGQALGACLGDVISNADPTHLEAAALLEKGERGAWKGWIPDLSAFDKVQPSEKEQVTQEMTPAGDPAGQPAAPVGEAKLLLETAAISTPLTKLDPTTSLGSLKLLKVEMKASAPAPTPDAPAVAPMTFTVDHTPENNQVNRINRTLQTLLAKQYGALPAGSQATLNLGAEDGYIPLRDRQALSGAASVLLGAALSGKAPTGIVIGRVDADGSFRTLPDLWERVRSLSGGPGGRLVIPAEAADLMPWLLALEDPEFFLKYDVLTASNYTELVERSLEAPAEPLAATLTRFQDVRAKGGTMPVGQYVTNRFVRQRVAEISSEAPYFLSPKLLAIQGSGERAVRIPPKILAYELRSALQPLEWVKGKASTDIDPAQLDKSHDLVRAQVDRLERYAESRDLLTKTREMGTTLRSFSRAARISPQRERGPAMMAEAYDEMTKSMADLQEQLDAAIGEVAADPDEDAAE